MLLPPNAPIFTAEAMRAAEQACAGRGTSLSTLMERAGRAVADVAWRMAARRPILILCGSGNNGGDGYVAARWLRIWGADVKVARLGQPKTDLAQAAAAAWDGPTEEISGALEPRSLVIDAIFGVGLSRPMEPELRDYLRPLQAGRILAVDVPSGMDADGKMAWQPALNADVCLALGGLKPAHLLLPSAPRCGTILRHDLGEQWESLWHSGDPMASELETPDHLAHKYNRGMVMVASGPMAGAADLAALGALRAGAGYVMKRGAAAPLAAIVTADEDGFAANLADPRCGAVVIGAGYPAGEGLRAEVAALWRSANPLVLDAAAIEAAMPFMLQKHHGRKLILTPHEGEFSRAFPDLVGHKLDRALAASARTGAVILYKGADMIIAAPDGRAAAFWPGSPWLASAGTGDVLAGAVAAKLAKGGDPFEMAKAAAGWHILKASRIGRGLVADDLVRNIYE